MMRGLGFLRLPSVFSSFAARNLSKIIQCLRCSNLYNGTHVHFLYISSRVEYILEAGQLAGQ